MGGSTLATTPSFRAAINAAWYRRLFEYFVYPRSAWLRWVEEALRAEYPQASSDDLTLTARQLAPFPLANGANVP